METVMIRLSPTISVALEVISGKYGVGVDRKKALEREGYNYNKVQNCVNQIMKLMDKYGD